MCCLFLFSSWADVFWTATCLQDMTGRLGLLQAGGQWQYGVRCVRYGVHYSVYEVVLGGLEV